MHKTNVLFMQSQTYFGADSMIHSLAMRHLDRSRFAVHVACNRGTTRVPSVALREIEAIPDVHVRRTSFGPTVHYVSSREIVRQVAVDGPRAVGSLAGLVDYARRNKVEVVHCSEKPRDAFYGFLLARAVGAACVVHVHVGVDHRWMSQATRLAMRHADALIGVSDFVSESAVRAGYDPARVHTVLNALDSDGWGFDPVARDAVRAEFGIAQDMPVMAIVARICPWKGYDQLLPALAKLRAQGYDFRLLLVGDDDPRSTPGHVSYLAEVRQMVEDLSLTDEVVFTGFRSDVNAIMSAADLYTMPSSEEPFGVVFLEALVAERPVVALANGGTVQAVEDGVTGLLSSPHDVDAFAANIRSLLDDPARRAAMGTEGRRQVTTAFRPERLAADVAAVYEQALAQRGKK